MGKFRRELRYLVFKLKDIDRYLSPREWETLVSIENKIIAARDKERRPQLSTVVVERDWPEFETVWGMIEARMLGVKNKYEVEIERLRAEIAASVPAPIEGAKYMSNDWYYAEGWNDCRHAMLDAQTAPSVPDEWIDPNDKTQTRYLPHIGEPVLFSHKGRVYYGKHTGGSFTAGAGVSARQFVTWDCMWRPIPAAPGAQENNDG